MAYFSKGFKSLMFPGDGMGRDMGQVLRILDADLRYASKRQ
jgi:hypothetical protein